MILLGYDQDEGAGHASQLELEVRSWLSPLLFSVLMGLTFDVYRRTGYKIVVTCVNRSEAQNKAVGGYEHSGHLKGYAVDIRTRNMTPEVLEYVLEYLEANWSRYFIYSIYHNHHIHIGVFRKDQTIDYSQYAEAKKQDV